MSTRSWELDRISASRMHVAEHVSLTSHPDSITIRFKLRRMGLDLDAEHIKPWLALVDEIGTQRMLNSQPVFVRYAAVERDLPPEEPIWE